MTASEPVTKMSDFSSKEQKRDRTSIGSRPLSFNQKKGKFAGGVMPTNPDRLDRLRKDALEDFNRATVERPRSVHQMAAMFAHSSSADKIESKEQTEVDAPVTDEVDGWRVVGGRMGPPMSRGKSSPGAQELSAGSAESMAAAGDAGSPWQLERESGSRKSIGRALSSSSLSSSVGTLPESESAAANAWKFVSNGSSICTSPTRQSRFSSFSSPSTTDLRALDLKQQHLDEARALARNRSANVKDIASAFRGESRPENVEVFQKRHAQQEAAYRYKVHEGKETLKKTSQGTDAMYNFVLNLNLATTEGKERFMRRWAIGRMANGEPTTPVDGWKFLQSLGIDVAKKNKKTVKPAATSGDDDGAKIDETATVHARTDGKIKAISPPATPSRGRTAVRGGCGFGSTRAGSVGAEAGAAGDPESSAWETALSRAVGGLVKVDADACAPQFVRNHRRRRSGSEPRHTTPKLPQAPETCRPTRSNAFWGSTPAKGGKRDDTRGRGSLSLSPSTTPPPRLGMPQRWRDSQDSLPAMLREGGSLDVRTSGVSEAGSCPGTPTRGLRLSLARVTNSPSRFSLSPGRRVSDNRSSLTPTEEQAEISAVAALSAVVEWESPPHEHEPLGLLQLPERLLEGGSDEEEEGNNVDDIPPGVDESEHGTTMDGVSGLGDSLHDGDRSSVMLGTSVTASECGSFVRDGSEAVCMNAAGTSAEGKDDEAAGSEEDFEDRTNTDSGDDRGFFVNLKARLSAGSGESNTGIKALTVAAGRDVESCMPTTGPKSPQEVQDMFERAIRLSEVRVEGPGTLSDGDDDEEDAATVEYNEDSSKGNAVDDFEASRHERKTQRVDGEKQNEQEESVKEHATFGSEPEDDDEIRRGQPSPMQSKDVEVHPSEAENACAESENCEKSRSPSDESPLGAARNGIEWRAQGSPNGDKKPMSGGSEEARSSLVWNVTFEVDSSHSLPAESSHSMRSADLMCSEVLSSSDDVSIPSDHLTMSDAAPETVSDIISEGRSDVASQETASDSSGHELARDGVVGGNSAASPSPDSWSEPRGKPVGTPGPRKDLMIELDADVPEEELPAPKLTWEAKSTAMGSPSAPSHDDDDDDSDDIDVGGQEAELQKGAPPMIAIVSGRVNGAEIAATSKSSNVAKDGEDEQNAAGWKLEQSEALSETGAERLRMSLTPGLLDESAPAFWDGLAKMMRSPRTPSSFNLDAQIMEAADVVNTPSRVSKKNNTSPAFMCPASPASSFSGSDGSVPDDGSDCEAEPEATDVEDNIQVDVGEEARESLAEAYAMGNDELEKAETVALVDNDITASTSTNLEIQDEEVTGNGSQAGDADDKPEIDVGVEESETNNMGPQQTAHDDGKDELDAGTGEDEVSSIKDHALDPSECEDLAVFPYKQAQQKNASETTKERSMTGKTESTSSPGSRRTSADPAPSGTVPGNFPTTGSSEMSCDAQTSSTNVRLCSGYSADDFGEVASVTVKSPAVPSTPLPVRTGQPMMTPVPSPAGSTDTCSPRMSPQKAAFIEQMSDILGLATEEAEQKTAATVAHSSAETVSEMDDESEAPAAGGDEAHDSEVSDDDGKMVDQKTQEEEETAGSESNWTLEVSTLNPYEDFDAVHDRQQNVMDTPRIDCDLAFCRPRTGTFYNPSTRSSGFSFFASKPEDFDPTGGGITPSGPASGTRARSGTIHNNPSTRGNGRGFFRGPTAEDVDGVSSAGQPEFNLFAGIFGFCRPRSSARYRGMTSALNSNASGVAFFPAVEEENVANDIADDCVGVEHKDIIDVDGDSGEPEEIVGKHVSTGPVQRYFGETLGLGCLLS